MPIHCHTCTCTKKALNRQYGPDPKVVTLFIDNEEIVINIKHRLYGLRHSLISRCYNAKPHDYKNYQGKGIEVCDDWKNNPASFYEWCLRNGWEKGKQLDRINPDLNYEPNNCQFLTASENSKKSLKDRPFPRNVKLDKEKVKDIKKLISDGLSLSEVAKRFNVCRTTISNINKDKVLYWKGV